MYLRDPGPSLILSSLMGEPKVLEYFQLAVTRISKKHLIVKVGLEYQGERKGTSEHGRIFLKKKKKKSKAPSIDKANQ